MFTPETLLCTVIFFALLFVFDFVHDYISNYIRNFKTNSNAIRIEKKKRYFQTILNKIQEKAATQRTLLVKSRQRLNVNRLCAITKNELQKFRMELPPRIYDEVNLIIENYTRNQEFEKLFYLYSQQFPL